MTIYILDNDPNLTVQALDDKSLDKQIKDIAQVLCNVHHYQFFFLPFPKKMADFCKHPPLKVSSNKHIQIWSHWTRKCKANYLYLVELGLACTVEWALRYNGYMTPDKCKESNKLAKLNTVICWARDNVPDLPITQTCRNCDGNSDDYYGEGYPCDQCNVDGKQEKTQTSLPLTFPKKYIIHLNVLDITDTGDQDIESYRNYYQAKLKQLKDRINKGGLSNYPESLSWTDYYKWTNRAVPKWLSL